MELIEFNLLDEPWIKVMSSDGKVDEVGIRTLFENAHTYRDLSGELPTQDLAVLRMLIAVVHSVYNSVDAPIGDVDDAVGLWSTLWGKGRFEGDRFKEYLDRYSDRFWLFHPEHPFYQAPITKGTEYSTSKLIGELSESANKVRLFCPFDNESKRSVGYAEAARWLLYINGYDDNSGKPTVKGAGMLSCGVGWIGKLGPVLVTGKNLFETILLNTVFVYSNPDEEIFPAGHACWEKEKPSVAERVPVDSTQVASQSEILTLQSRRIHLKREVGRVVGYTLIGGDIYPKENAVIEQMTVWRVTDDGSLVPKRHDSARLMWRDYSALVCGIDQDGKSIRSPGVVKWVGYLREMDVPVPEKVSVRVLSVQYGDKDFMAIDQYSDRISVSTRLLDRMDEAWNGVIMDGIDDADYAVRCLTSFAYSLCIIRGLDPNQDKGLISERTSSVRVDAFFRLDIPFRRWISDIDPLSTDYDQRQIVWRKTVHGIIKDIGDKMLDDCSPTMVTGRSIETENGHRVDNAITAHFSFVSKLNKIGVKNDR